MTPEDPHPRAGAPASPTDPAPGRSLPGEAELARLASRTYAELTGGNLAVPVVWNWRLRTSGGRFVAPRPAVRRASGSASDGSPRIELNPRYAARGGEADLRDVLKHELAHYHLWAHGRAWGHGPEFRRLMRAWGFSRHARTELVPAEPWRWEYVCPACGRSYLRRRRISQRASCSSCSQRYDPRFRLVERRLRTPPG